jgi:hypothetical protein
MNIIAKKIIAINAENYDFQIEQEGQFFVARAYKNGKEVTSICEEIKDYFCKDDFARSEDLERLEKVVIDNINKGFNKKDE